MSPPRRAAARDSNEPDIATALEAVGASVTRLSQKGLPDLLVGWRGTTHLLEVKHLSATGKTVRRTSGGKRPDAEGRTQAQADWWGAWRGAAPVIVRTPAEALAAIGAPAPGDGGDR